MERRTFLVGLGAFVGSALVLPKFPTIFDMGRNTGIAATPFYSKSGLIYVIENIQQQFPWEPPELRTFCASAVYPVWSDGRLTEVRLREGAGYAIATMAGPGIDRPLSSRLRGTPI